MHEPTVRKKVRDALEKAASSGELVLSDLARKVGWSSQSLSKFRKSGHGDIKKVEALAKLLHARGLLEDLEPPTQQVTATLYVDECQVCGATVPNYYDGRRLVYCGACGEPLGVICGYCGTLNDRRRVTCVSCQWPLTEEAVRNKVAQDAALYQFNDPRRRKGPEEVLTVWRDQQRVARDSRKFKLPEKEGEPHDPTRSPGP